jgi:uncharacterized protein YkwD
MIAYALLALAASLSLPAVAHADGGMDTEESAFLTLINNYRAQHGASPLEVSAALENSAHWMSNDMAAKDYTRHTDSLGRDVRTRLKAFHYGYSPGAENIAGGTADAENTLRRWETACDPDASGACTYAHRINILNASFKVIGIGRAYSATSTYGWYWTTDFGGVTDQTISPITEAAPGPAAPMSADRVKKR